MKKFVLIILALVIVLAFNMSTGMLSQFGAGSNVLIAVLVAVVAAGLIANEHIGLVLLVIGVAIAANFSKETAASIGYDRDIMIALLVGLILLPFVARKF